jgi:hypothetical protein
MRDKHNNQVPHWPYPAAVVSGEQGATGRKLSQSGICLKRNPGTLALQQVVTRLLDPSAAQFILHSVTAEALYPVAVWL